MLTTFGHGGILIVRMQLLLLLHCVLFLILLVNYHAMVAFTKWFSFLVHACADLEGGSGGSGPPLEFAKLNMADITGNEKN